MTVNNLKPPTKTISFRIPTKMQERIIKAAKEKGQDTTTYFLSQIDQSSELGSIVKEEFQNVAETYQKVATAIVETMASLGEAKERSGIDDQVFISVVKAATEQFINDKKKELGNKRKPTNTSKA